MLRTVAAQPEPIASTLLAKQPGFSLHAATCCEANQRDKLEKLCRYIARPAIASERLSTNDRGQVIYRFKQPFRDGTTHVVLDPHELIARLAALVPPPRLNLTRFHGVFAPNCKHRESVVPKRKPRHEKPDKPLAPLTWMQRLKRVFAIDPNAARSRPAPSAVARCESSPASKIRMSLPQSLSTLVHARQPQLPSRERLRSNQRSPPRDTRPGSCRKRLPGATLRPLHEYPPLRAAFPRPFRLQSPPSHPQPAHRTPLTTSHERSFNQSYFATIPFRAVIRPIRGGRFCALLSCLSGESDLQTRAEPARPSSAGTTRPAPCRVARCRGRRSRVLLW